MKEKQAKQILEQVRKSYDSIADHFSQTRYRDWPEFSFFKQYSKSGDKVLDAGCGNGRLYASLKEMQVDYTGIDLSPQLIKKAKSKYPQAKFSVADVLNLPFTAEEFGSVISVATLHHIPSSEFQDQVIKQFYRVIKPGGYLMLTVWNLKQENFQQKIAQLPPKNIIEQKVGKVKDIWWPWKNSQGKVLTKRYLHSFSQTELEKLVNRNGFVIIKSFYSQKGEITDKNQGYNLCLIAQKMLWLA